MTFDGPQSVPAKSVSRVEDGKLLRGRGRFVDDIHLPGLLHAAFFRSSVAHAFIKRLDLSKARALAGVAAVYSYGDIRPFLTSDRIPLALPAAAIRFQADPPCLASKEVCYVGEPIAVVVAESRHVAEDALALIEIEYEQLPAVVDPEVGLDSGAPKSRSDCPDNLVAGLTVRYGDVETAFAEAPLRIAERFRLHKGGGHSIEPRGLVARLDEIDDVLTVWDSTQVPHRIRAVLSRALGRSESKIRVVNPDVGGGFGPKAVFHPEELVVPAMVLALGAPIKWIEDRLESFTATTQERDQIWQVEIATTREGRLLGIRGVLYHDHGAYTPYGVALPYNSASNLIGPYILPAYELDIRFCLTNMVPATPTRGAGRPQGTFVMERLLDRVAAELHLPRDEVRRRNLIPPEKMPFTVPMVMRDGAPMTYDTGDYLECQRRALEIAGWSDFPSRQAAARKANRLLGIGMANYVEATGRGPFESGCVRISPSGEIAVFSGATAQGQGVKTMLSQLAAHVFDVSPSSITVVVGDTNATMLGLGAFASRQAVTAGNAVFQAAQVVLDKAKRVVGGRFEVAIDDLEVRDGKIAVKGVPELSLSLGEIAQVMAGMPGFALPAGLSPGLSAACDYEPKGMTYTNGTHVVEAEVDIGTCRVKLNRYVVMHDCGRVINPMMVEGQIYGGAVHGIGATLFEWMRYDDAGQPFSVTYADYLLPTADVLPRIEIHHMESPTPLNPLGIKGAAESGTIGAPSAIIAAVEDALRPLDVRLNELPLTPARLSLAIKRARARS
jgi:carbon-monoxide dehydrogenase large subunit